MMISLKNSDHSRILHEGVMHMGHFDLKSGGHF